MSRMLAHTPEPSGLVFTMRDRETAFIWDPSTGALIGKVTANLSPKGSDRVRVVFDFPRNIAVDRETIYHAKMADRENGRR